MVKIDKPVLLISFPRTGSTWLHSYIEEFNNNNFGHRFVSPPSFLRSSVKEANIHGDIKTFNSSEEKFNFLEYERTNGREYSLKHPYLKIVDKDWFREFYKNYFKIKLVRKNIWACFLSNSFFERFNHRFSKFYYVPRFEIDPTEIDKFLTKVNRFNDCDLNDTLWYYEDLSPKKLRTIFDLNREENSELQIESQRRYYLKVISNYEYIKKLFKEKAQDKILNPDLRSCLEFL